MENKNIEGHRERLRKRYEVSGLSGFLDYEIIEVLLSYSIQRQDCKPIAKELIEKFGSVSAILDAEIKELCSVSGVGKTTALFLKLVKELNIIYLGETVKREQYIKGTSDLIKYIRGSIGKMKKELFKIIFLDTQNCVISDEVVFEGTIDRSHIYMREIVERVIKNSAKSVIFFHNHPSGKLTPSKQDIDFTLKAKKILNELEINLLDHIIVSDTGDFSFLENGII